MRGRNRPDAAGRYAGEQTMDVEQRVNGRVLGGAALALRALLTAARVTTTSAEHRKEAALVSLLTEAGEAASAQRNADAAAAYRRALQLDSGSFTARLGLARVLVSMEQWPEAQGHLSQLRTADPASSQVNLLSARAAWQAGELELASDYFHRAVYGYWPTEQMEERTRARILMVRLLAQRQDRGALAAELLRLRRELPENSPYRRETALLLLEAGLPAEAAQALRALLEEQPADMDLRLHLAEAELRLGNYLTARTQLRTALKENPDDDRVAPRLALVEQVLALDPLARRAGLAERHRRSRLLLEATIQHAERCGGVDAIGEHLESARIEAEEPYARASAESAIERNLQSAERLWYLLPAGCRSAEGGGEALFHVFARLEREAR
jgi:predicted Zn-dependent protease